MISDIEPNDLTPLKRQCQLCTNPFSGRKDKVFCSDACKAIYHYKLKKVTEEASERIDKILHRNRSILLEIMGKNSGYKKVGKEILDAKKFNWHYVTSYHINTQNKFVNYIYDFSWMIFSDQEIVIKRIR
jgi:predicted nucleic acid-binding Zn ribbon protein